ncbi:MAG: protein jag [Lachnospiraceae bacterium]|nr:protein jag [Lachnospiraceae bacterium]
MEYIEVSGKSFEDAVSDACKQLECTSEELEYEIVDMGSSGFLGFNSKPTIIKARVKEEVLEARKAAKQEEEKKEKEIQREKEKEEKAEQMKAAEEKKETRKQSESRQEKKEQTKEKKSVEKQDEKRNQPLNISEDEVISTVKAFLADVFKAMDMEVDVDVKCSAEEGTVDVELSGKEMGVLIGKRGQTLDSLQYLISLVVNKGTSGYLRVKVDTENYRARRKATLENLAKNLSFKVKRTKRPVTLEPMNPYERRIIHSALQGDRYVTTHSEGEEPFRRVVITLK